MIATRGDDPSDARSAIIAWAAAMPTAYWNMVQTAEYVAKTYGVGREAQDRYGARSQQRAAAAQKAGKFADEIVPFKTTMERTDKATGATTKVEVTLDSDEGIRQDTTYEGISAIKPVVEGAELRRGPAVEMRLGGI